MTISALNSMTTGISVTRVAPSAGSGFAPLVAVGQGHTARGHGAHTQDNRTQETGAVGAPAGVASAPSLADDTRALVGDVFGALGAQTPTAATAQQAVEAYRRAG